MPLYAVEGNKLKIDLHPGQSRAWKSERRFIFAIAGTQGGKTSFGPLWLDREIMRCGPGDYMAVTATAPLSNVKMIPELVKYFGETRKIGRLWDSIGILELADPTTGQFWAKKSKDPMWGRIILRSAESKNGLESATAKAAWLDECGMDSFTIDTWLAVRRRLSLARGRVFAGTTPYNLGWMKTQIVDKAHSDPNIDLINFPSILNPTFPRGEFEEMRSQMPEWKFNMFYRGLFERPAGMIYSDFVNKYEEDGGHKVRPFTPSPDWPRFVGVDPGAVNTAMIWLAHNPERDVYYLYRESLEGDKSTPQHAQGAAALAKKNNERVIMYYVGQKAETQQRMDWKAAGVRNVKEPTVHDVDSGIDRVIQLLKQHRLYIFDDCLGVLDEIGRYARKLDDYDQPTEVIADKETYHRLDALRYAAVGVTSKRGILVG